MGIKINRNSPPIFHLLYADDLMISCKANEINARSIESCLTRYCKWTRQEINFDKSQIWFSQGTNIKVKRSIQERLGLKLLNKNTLYLGNNLVFSRNKSKEF